MASGVSSSAASSAFNAGDADQAVEYRSMSIAALVGLVLGVLSPLYFGAALLILIPLAGMAISIFALYQIGKSEGGMVGRWAAFIGLFLSAAMLVAPNARGYVIETMRLQQAEKFGTAWLGMMTSGKVKEAFRLTNNSMVASPPPAPGEKAPAADPYDTFVARPIVKAITAAGAEATIRFLGAEGIDPQTFPRVFVNQLFEVAPGGKAGGQPVKARLIVERTRVAKEGRSRWIVWAIEDGNKPVSEGSAKP